MNEEVQNSYDRVAEDYARHFRNEMSSKPFDRKMLDWLAEKVGDLGVICDMGCGPGQVADYLHGQGKKVCGVDISFEMVRQAQNLNPEISFQQGDTLNLIDIADDSYGGVAALYLIVHIPRREMVKAMQELYRVLRPKGALLLAFHIGREIKRLEEWWGKEVSLDFLFFETAEVKNCLIEAGFELEEVIERDPYAETVEYPSRRAYLFAKKA